MNIHRLNKVAWDAAVDSGDNPYTRMAAPEQIAAAKQGERSFHFSHTMEAQLGGLTEAGFFLTGFYEDRRLVEDGNPIRHYMPSYFVVRAVKGNESIS